MEPLKFSLDAVLERAGAFFMKQSPIHRAVHRLAKTLNEMEIPFAIAGALAVNAHGHVRTTEDVDVLLRREDLARFREAWLGRGWVEKFAGSRGMRDAINQVNIDVLLAGDYPGDGLPKPVVFPDPAASVTVENDGIPVLKLAILLELKIASGMTAKHRPTDLGDVIHLIRRNHLSQVFGAELNAYVREKYDELWLAAQIDEDY